MLAKVDKRLGLSALVIMLMAALPSAAQAHVKWFADFSFSDRPRTLSEVINPLTIGMTVLSVVVIGALVVVDRKLEEDAKWYNNIRDWLADRKDKSRLVMRIAAGASLLMAWQAGSMLVPELGDFPTWIGWAQFVIAVMLIFDRAVPFAGVGLGALYVIGIFEFGIFHMLDYALFAGVAWYLIATAFEDPMIEASAIPVLYATVGFSLIWVGIEKLVYPQWSFYILEQNPQLTLGFPTDFFLVGAAFVEIALGYLLIIGLLSRPLALIITLVFFMTTMVFGKVEVIGHTIIHGALIVFLLEGPGELYKPPIDIHKRMPLRVAFGAVNFVIVLAALMAPYTWGAWQRYEAETADVPLDRIEQRQLVEGAAPDLTMAVHEGRSGHYMTVDGIKGHAHLYINGWKADRIYGEWVTLPELEPGRYEIEVVQANHHHQELARSGEPIAAREVLIVKER